MHTLTGMRMVGAVVVGICRGAQLQTGILVVAQGFMLVVPVIQRMCHLVRQSFGLAQPLRRQSPCHRLQQQAEQQEPSGEGSFHSGEF